MLTNPSFTLSATLKYLQNNNEVNVLNLDKFLHTDMYVNR